MMRTYAAQNAAALRHGDYHSVVLPNLQAVLTSIRQQHAAVRMTAQRWDGNDSDDDEDVYAQSACVIEVGLT